MNGILLINKPKGVSSFHYMKQVQRKLKLAKVGHLGTLDPAACGLLVLLCGSATKLNQQLSGKTKTYQSQFTFGIETDTLDSEGKIVATSDVIPTQNDIKNALFSGKIEIEIPKYSAVHINGKRAYELARKGIEFESPKKIVNILRFEMLNELRSVPDPASHWFEIECETGTYIRSLAKLLATKLGTVAIASEIIRTRIGEFKLEDAKTLENVELCDILLV